MTGATPKGEMKKRIEELFKDENLPEQSIPSANLKKFQLTPSDVLLELERQRNQMGLDRRQFTRIDVGEKKLELKFHNEMHFAKQYIDNISIGGLFVKTDAPFKMGDTVPIEFSIPLAAGESHRRFALEGKVCRITENGVGLEFVHLDKATRRDLEAYIQTILPPNTQMVTPKAKLASIEKLEQLREAHRSYFEKKRNVVTRVALILLLVALNGIMLKQSIDHSRDEKLRRQGSNHFYLGSRQIAPERIKKVEYNGKSFVFHLDSKETITLKDADASLDRLPYHMHQTLKLLKTLPRRKPPRVSKNAPSLTHLR